MQINETLIRSVVEQVLSEVRGQRTEASSASVPHQATAALGRFGLFSNAEDCCPRRADCF